MPISRPGISVIIPAYNAERYLEETVQSVREQQWEGPLEIIVVNDGSADSTEALAKSLGCRVISLPQSGPAAARNEGIKNALHDLIFFLDADDVLAEGSFEVLYAPMAQDPAVSAVFGRAKDFISPDVPPDEAKKIRYNVDGYEGRLTGCSFLKKDVLEQVGPFDESLKSGETVDWMVRLRASSVRIARIPDIVLLRRIHLSNMGRLDPRGEMMNYAAILRKRMKKK